LAEKCQGPSEGAGFPFRNAPALDGTHGVGNSGGGILLPMTATQQAHFVLHHSRAPERKVQVRIEGPQGYEGAGEALPHVLVLHGFKGFMHWGFFPELSRRIAQRGMVAVSLNTSGSGVGDDFETLSEEGAFFQCTFSHDLEDLDLVRQHLLENGSCVDMERLAIWGHSRGGGMALLHAERCGDYKASVLWGPINRVRIFDEQTRLRWRAEGEVRIPNGRTGQVHRIGLDLLDDIEQNAAQLDILSAASRTLTPTLIVHGSADEAVPLKDAESLHVALPQGSGELCVLPEAGHTFGTRHPFEGCSKDLEAAFEVSLAHLSRHLSQRD
jgi:dipeptidyl aminopeptidase/acylaminoacyl peptidase